MRGPFSLLLVVAALTCGCSTAPEGSDNLDLVITTDHLPQASVGSPYGQGLSWAGGQAPFIWSLDDPGLHKDWLKFDQTKGIFGGRPEAEVPRSPIRVTLKDSTNQTYTEELDLAVGPCLDGTPQDGCKVHDDKGCHEGTRYCKAGQFGACEDLRPLTDSLRACGARCLDCTKEGGSVCTDGQCMCGSRDACTPNQDCCNDIDPSNAGGKHCVAQGTPDNCGSCTVCGTFNNAGRVCDNGACKYPCKPGFGNCDAKSLDCETPVTENLNHCGACGNVCGAFSPDKHAEPACASGACVAKCSAGFESCGAPYADGCPFDTRVDPARCGSCTNKCNPGPHVTGLACINGSCAITACEPGFANCNGNFADGCEANLSADALNCGSCGFSCLSPPNVSGAACSAGSCQVTQCRSYVESTNVRPTGNCNNAWPDGCEVNLNTDSNCGACGKVCPKNAFLPVANYSCNSQLPFLTPRCCNNSGNCF